MAEAKPVADACAVVGAGEQTNFIELGPVWISAKGNLTFTMHTEPLAWRDGYPRRIVISQRKDARIEVKRNG